MKNNFDIKINPPKLGREDINKHKNFDALLEQFQQAGGTQGGKELPLPTEGRFFVKYIVGGSLAIAASIALLFVFRGMFDGGAGNNNALALHAPFDQAQKAFASFELDADKGDTIHHISGSTIIVPASAFVDKGGKPVNGKVDIQYREFDDPVDLFLAGIPQKKDNQHLQTAGVMQIQGFQDGEPVYINKDRKLQMELKSTVPADLPIEKLKVYAYTAGQEDWKYKMEDKVEVLNEIGKLEDPTDTTFMGNNGADGPKNKAEVLVQLQKKHPLPIKPLEPSKLSADMQPFDVELNTKDFPELAQYGEIIWVANKSKIKDEWFEIDWSNMKVQRKGDLKYEIVFSTESQKVVVEAAPIVPFNKKARKDYEKAMVVYTKQLAEQRNKIETDLKAWEQTGGAHWVSQDDKNSSDDQFALRQIINRFEIEQFGLWNCANPVSLDDIQTVNANFVAEKGGAVAVQDIFVADQKRHLYYSTKANESLHFDAANEQAQLWVMDKNQQLWVATPNPVKEGDRTRFILQPAADIRTEQDVRRVLVF
jgi:hypothetical protein